MSKYKTSKEGWNFDNLEKHVKEWNRIGQQNFYVSEPFLRNHAQIQLLKSYDRVVGLLERETGLEPLVIRLGNWSRTTSCQITKFVNKNKYMCIDVSKFNQDSIDALQSGL